MSWLPWLAVAVVVASSGCFSEILPGAPASTLAFACAAIDPATAPRLRVVTYVDGVELDVDGPTIVLLQQLVALSGRDPLDVTPLQRDPPRVPADGWSDDALERWVRDEPFLGRDQVTLRILWLPLLGQTNVTGLVPAAGAVVLSEQAIVAGAQRLGRPVEEVATAVLLHFVGHALGATNRGIPVQDPDLQVREGPPGHDADPGSVLAVGWESPHTMKWAANATYDRYSDVHLSDWAAAREPLGVCGVRR